MATIVAHELAHKWFGNLVTCFWWSNLWLNESFASYFEHFGAHMVNINALILYNFSVVYILCCVVGGTQTFQLFLFFKVPIQIHLVLMENVREILLFVRKSKTTEKRTSVKENNFVYLL